MNLIVAVSVVIGLLVILRFWLTKPIKHKVSDINELEKFLKGLIDQFEDGAVIAIKHKKSKKFIQFTKYSNQQQVTYFHFGFPDAPWSREIFLEMQNIFDKENIEYEIMPTSEKYVNRFLEINLIPDVNIAMKITKLAIDAMELPANELYQVYYQGKLSKNSIEKLN